MRTRILSQLLVAAAFLATTALPGFAQAPAAPAPVYTPAQSAALLVAGMNVPTQLGTAQAKAARELVAATWAQPANRKDLTAKVQALADAELKLALARADALQKGKAIVAKVGTDLDKVVAEALGRSYNRTYSDYTGFTKLWDGKTFTNWDLESDFWSIDHDAIHASTLPPPDGISGQHHMHYVGPGAVMKDFDFRVEVKMSEMGANGGIQYRSRLLNPIYRQANEAPLAGTGRDWKAAEADPLGKRFDAKITSMADATAAGLNPQGNLWQISGYQFDMSSDGRYPGQLYEGQGRGIVTGPGGFVIMYPNRQTVRAETILQDSQQYTKPHKGLDGEWNQFEVIAKGNTLIHMINGHVVTVGVDWDPSMAALQGILSLQLEGRGQIWYRNVYVKPL